jgi:hypothetical protein
VKPFPSPIDSYWIFLFAPIILDQNIHIVAIITLNSHHFLHCKLLKDESYVLFLLLLPAYFLAHHENPLNICWMAELMNELIHPNIHLGVFIFDNVSIIMKYSYFVY